ncbi:MAG TPA: AI-2E family transporter [Clostridia bacterium]|nr:AI-2E family transporter [Clostridia bacterium]
MTILERARQLLTKPEQLSYVLIVLLFVLMGWLHLSSLLLAALFSYLALQGLQLGRKRNRWLSVILFVVLLSAVVYTSAIFGQHAFHALPHIADKAIPSVLHWARDNNIELPFADYDSLRELALETIRGQLRYIGSFARYAGATANLGLFLIAGCVVAIGLFLNPRFELSREPDASANNLYTVCCAHLAERFRIFYRSFATVMGAQILISAINTAFTGIFVTVVQLPYAFLIVGVTFLCGLLPVIGNLISNTIIVGIGFTVSPKMAMTALIFLVVIHKLEYFLNSTIIGSRIRNPLWLTLIGLIIGERLLGIPGIILAPVFLNYIKRETSRFDLPVDPPPALNPPPESKPVQS